MSLSCSGQLASGPVYLDRSVAAERALDRRNSFAHQIADSRQKIGTHGGMKAFHVGATDG
jgi:hypothetical protein